MQTFRPPRPRPPHPAPPQGILVQKIIACERRSVPALCAEWRFDGCTGQTIQNVSAAGTPCWHVENGCMLHLSLPVSVQLGSCCHSSTHSAVLEVETPLPHSFHGCLGDSHITLLVLPWIRLLCAEEACGVFRVKLQLSLELYLLRYETLHTACKPECPPLPLYPPPIC